MIGQHNHRIDGEGATPAYLTKRSPQIVDVLRRQLQMSVRQIDGEEEAASNEKIAAIIGYANILA